MSGRAEESKSVTDTPSIWINTQAPNITTMHRIRNEGETTAIGECTSMDCMINIAVMLRNSRRLCSASVVVKKRKGTAKSCWTIDRSSELPVTCARMRHAHRIRQWLFLSGHRRVSFNCRPLFPRPRFLTAEGTVRLSLIDQARRLHIKGRVPLLDIESRAIDPCHLALSNGFLPLAYCSLWTRRSLRRCS